MTTKEENITRWNELNDKDWLGIKLWLKKKRTEYNLTLMELLECIYGEDNDDCVFLNYKQVFLKENHKEIQNYKYIISLLYLYDQYKQDIININWILEKKRIEEKLYKYNNSLSSNISIKDKTIYLMYDLKCQEPYPSLDSLNKILTDVKEMFTEFEINDELEVFKDLVRQI